MPSELTKIRARRLRWKLSGISWMAVLALLMAITATVLVIGFDQRSAVALAVVALTFAVLSLKET